VCSDPDSGSSVNLGTRTATIDLDAGETVTCTFTNTDPSVSGDIIYVSSSSGGTAGVVSFKDEDVLAFDPASGAWSMYFDGSDVGVTDDISGFQFLNDGSILMTFTAAIDVPGAGLVDDSDIVRFVPTSTGDNTAGSFTLFFDGSDVGLEADGEDIDAIGATPDGRLVISMTAGFNVPGASGRDEDLIVFNATSFGADTAGTFELYVDASDVGLSGGDVDGAWIDPANGDIYLSKSGSVSVSGFTGDASDIFIFTPTSTGETTSGAFGPYWDGSDNGFGGENTDDFSIGDGANLVVP